MAHTVWKATLRPSKIQVVEVPIGAEFLCAHMQGGDIAVWFRCDPTETLEKRKIAICGTGNPAPSPEQGKYIGSVLMHDAALVFHLFWAAA